MGSAHNGAKMMREIMMRKIFVCRDLFMDCDFEACNENEESLKKIVEKHVKDEHGITEIKPEWKAKVKAAIKNYNLTSSTSERLLELIKKINSEIKPGMDKELQTELGRILKLVPGLEKFGDMILIELANTATSALIRDSKNIHIAKKIICKIQWAIRSALWRKTSIPVIAGLGISLFYIQPVSNRLTSFFETVQINGFNASMLGLVVFMGAIGSIVSILSRIKYFATVKDPHLNILVLTGFFKPMIGMAFALFVYLVLSSKIIPIEGENINENYFYAAISFVSGFSERFARDVISRTEEAV